MKEFLIKVWNVFIGILLTPFYIAIFIIELALVLIGIFLVCIGKFSINSTFIQKYTYAQLVSVDQSINAIMAGDIDETISSRAGRAYPNTWWSNLIDWLFFWQTNHCHKSIEPWEGKNDLLFPRTDFPTKKEGK